MAKPFCPPMKRIGDGRYLVTDWNGRAHHFRDLDKAIAFAAEVQDAKPDRPAYDVAERGIARWGRPISPIKCRGEAKFSHGRAVSLDVRRTVDGKRTRYGSVRQGRVVYDV